MFLKLDVATKNHDDVLISTARERERERERESYAKIIFFKSGTLIEYVNCFLGETVRSSSDSKRRGL